MSKISNGGRFFIFQPFQFFQDMTTLIHKCHSSIREIILIVKRLVDHGQLVIVPMVVVDVMLMIGHGIHEKGTFPFQIFPAVEKQVVTSAPRLQWLPLSSVRTFMEIDERVFTSKLSSSSPCTLSKRIFSLSSQQWEVRYI